ncbi:MAG: hypothetical protein GEU88_04160 [Solirubrobacterales bacterium]|nr:hypothetical protein [Solirubrobacterales bacterium]
MSAYVQPAFAATQGERDFMKATSLKKKITGLLIVVGCSALVAPALAGAQQVSPTDNQYSDQVEQVTPPANDVSPDGNDESNAGGSPGGNDDGTPPAATNVSNAAPNSASASGLSARVGPLPFTGFDVIAMAAVALAVTGLGLALQRAVSRRSSDLA